MTTGATPHNLPHAALLPTGDLVIVYETGSNDIHFKRGAFAGLNAAAEVPVATGPETDRHPFVLVVPSSNQVIFFYHRSGAPSKWFCRVRQYTPAWTEAGATMGAEQELIGDPAASPNPARGDFHAAVDGSGQVWIAYRTSADNIQALRFTGGGFFNQQVLSTPGADQMPFVLVDGNQAVYVFWQAGANGPINYQRFLKGPNAWDAGPTLVPDTTTGTNNLRPCVVRDTDGAIWLFWSSDRGGNHDIWLRAGASRGWSQARRSTTSTRLLPSRPMASSGCSGAATAAATLICTSNRSSPPSEH